MIHHLSISATDPKHVADVLAELLDGRCYRFPGGIPDSWMAVSGDEHATLIEVYPKDITLRPGQAADQQVAALRDQPYPGTVPFHFLLSVKRDLDWIKAVGAREGWRTEIYGRGAPGHPPLFHVIEFWIENRLMVELATPEMAAQYASSLQFDVLDRLFGGNPATPSAERTAA